jgi:hypothetical protein
MDEAERMVSWHLVGPDGGIASAGAAIPALLRLLPAGRPIAGIAARFPRGLERGYGWVSRHRGTLGRTLTAGADRRAERVIERAS